MLMVLQDLNFARLIFQSLIVTVAAMLILRPFSFKIGLVDRPNARKKHQIETPLIGGLAIYLAFAIAILTGAVHTAVNTPFLISVTIIVVVGLLDDFKDLGFRVRLLAEVAAALIMVKWGGIEITSLGDLLGFGEIKLGFLSIPFTVFAIVGGINAFNMIDGIDGLAGSTSLIIYLLLSGLFLIYGGPEIIVFSFIFVAATIGFLLFNFPLPQRKNALAFLGDTGSMLFGFTICCLVISASQDSHHYIAPATALWLIGAPILDTVCVMIRRVRRGRSPFEPDREHLHHILNVVGYDRFENLFFILLFGASLSVFGLVADVWVKAPNWLMFYLFLVLFSGYFWSLSHAWRVAKVVRYFREHRIFRSTIYVRRKMVKFAASMEERRVIADRRKETDGPNDIDKAYAMIGRRFARFVSDVYNILRNKRPNA